MKECKCGPRIPHGVKGWMIDEFENKDIRTFWLEHKCVTTNRVENIVVGFKPDAIHYGVIVTCKACGQSKDVTSYEDI